MQPLAGYSRTQIVLHWAAFAIVAQQYLFKDAISAAWERVSEGAEVAFDPLVLGHVAGGVLVVVFAIWRLMLRARRGVPPQSGSASQKTLAKLVHLGLYALMFLMPISGSVAWFGGVEAAAFGHNVMKVMLLAFIALHVAGAMYHQFVLRDGILTRMRRPQD
jgi:cytochrome b561